MITFSTYVCSQDEKNQKRKIEENSKITTEKIILNNQFTKFNPDSGLKKIMNLRNRRFNPDSLPNKKLNFSTTISQRVENICNIQDNPLFLFYVEDPKIIIDPASTNNVFISYAKIWSEPGTSPAQLRHANSTFASLDNANSFPYSWDNWMYQDAAFHSSPAFGPTGTLYNSMHIWSGGYITTGGWDQVRVRKSYDKGINWSGSNLSGLPFIAYYPEYLQGNSLSIDYNTISPYYGDFYAVASHVYNNNGLAVPFVNFSYSPAGQDAETWSTPIQLANNPSTDPIVETGINGEVYVAWSDFGPNYNLNNYSIGFSRLDVGSNTFTTPIFINVSPIDLLSRSVFNQLSVYSYPVLAVDKSNGPHRGRIYMAISAVFSNRSSILVFYSDNNGNTWSSPNFVNTEFKQAFNPWLSVDNITGKVNIAYYAFDNPQTNSFWGRIYLSSSSDGIIYETGAVSDENFLLEDKSGYDGNGVWFDASNPGRVGLVSHNGTSYVCWQHSGWADGLVFSKTYNNAQNQSYLLQGPDNFCGSALYSVVNYAPGMQLNWFAQPAGLVTILDHNNGTATITAIAHGNVTISAELIDPCNTYLLSKNVAVGNGLTGSYLTSEGYSLTLTNNNITASGLTQVLVNVNNDPNATIRWNLINGGPLNWSSYNLGRNLNFNLSYGSVTFRAFITSACGYSTSDYTFTATPVARIVKSDNYLLVKTTVIQNISKGGSYQSNNGIDAILMYDLTGRLIKSSKFSGINTEERIQIPSNISGGSVILHIICQGQKVTKMMVIK